MKKRTWKLLSGINFILLMSVVIFSDLPDFIFIILGISEGIWLNKTADLLFKD